MTGADDALLRSLHDHGPPAREFERFLRGIVRHALTKVPPPDGSDRWTDVHVDEAAGDLIESKWEKLAAAMLTMESDRQLRAWLERTAENYVNDLGRGTPRGRLTRRVERIVADMPGFSHDKVVVTGPNAGDVSPLDRDRLLELTWPLPTTTAYWADPREDPSPGDRADIIALVELITAAADGPVAIDMVVDVIAYRLNLPLRWNVGYVDESAAAVAVEPADLPPASADGAARLMAKLTEKERLALPHYATDPSISAMALGRAIGKGKSTGATVKASLETKLHHFAVTDEDAEGALRYVGRAVLAGQTDAPGRSQADERKETDA